MIMTTLEWQLHQVPAGSEVVLIDAKGHPIARGIVSRDRRILYGPNGEHIPVSAAGAAGAAGVRLVRRPAA
jgi:hypothetical protein